MAQRAKYTYRGRTYTRKSLRPGKRTVTVRAYCRRKARKAGRQIREAMPF